MRLILDRVEFIREYSYELGCMTIRKKRHYKLVETNIFRMLLENVKIEWGFNKWFK